VRSESIPPPAARKAPVWTHYKRAALLAKPNMATRYNLVSMTSADWGWLVRNFANALDRCSDPESAGALGDVRILRLAEMGSWRKASIRQTIGREARE
jgi:hypothetical protein